MARLSVRIIPNSSRSEIVGREGIHWKIRLAAPPIDGKANDALIRFLADLFDCAPSEIDILKGHGSKIKTLSIPMHEEDIEEALTAQDRARRDATGYSEESASASARTP